MKGLKELKKTFESGLGLGKLDKVLLKSKRLGKILMSINGLMLVMI